MLILTEADERITVRCSCGCYSLSAHKPATAPSGLVRCLICGARAGLSELLADWRIRSARTELSNDGRLS
jgi:hypothetical protein